MISKSIRRRDRRSPWSCLVLGLVAVAWAQGCGGEGPLEPLDSTEPVPIEEDLNAAFEELLATEGKADGAYCSGVRAPDNGPFSRKIALTFDDGPSLEKTPRVLDILDDHDARATFFINGRQVRTAAHWDLLREIVDRGHILGNHSQNHIDSKHVSLSRWQDEVQQTHDILASVLADFGQEPTYFRFPYGSANCSTYNVVTGFGYHVVGWHIDTADWCFQSPTGGRGYCSSSTFRYVPDSYRDDYPGFSVYQADKAEGGILLMHDIHSYTVDHLDALLTRLEDHGFSFTTLDDIEHFPLLNNVTPPRDPWIGDPCTEDAECDFWADGERAYCFTFADEESEEPNGFCSLPCEGYCPDMDGTAETFCVLSPVTDAGMCVSKARPINESCESIPGTVARTTDRFVGQSTAPESTSVVCVP